jgi:hypothetical protein
VDQCRPQLIWPKAGVAHLPAARPTGIVQVGKRGWQLRAGDCRSFAFVKPFGCAAPLPDGADDVVEVREFGLLPLRARFGSATLT